MKALSLWQPWASAIAVAAKRIETRSWPTNYRGPLAIHAAKRFDAEEMTAMAENEIWLGALWPTGFGRVGKSPKKCLPLGAIVATCLLVDCRPTESFASANLDHRKHRIACGPDTDLYSWTERMMGDFSPGRFGWMLEDIVMIEPIPFRGTQGLFDVPDELFAEAKPCD